MFTGVVEVVGVVRKTEERDTTRRIRIGVPEWAGELQPGSSVAVDGACLTAVEVDEEGFSLDAVGTTLSRTVAGDYRPGTRVNLERAMPLGDRLEGHLVQGHVDGVGRLLDVRREGEYRLMDFEIPEEVAAFTLLHGSIALNGVSLTVNALSKENGCQVAIIPFTWKHTNLGDLQPGDRVNVEGDLIGKYVGKMLGHTASEGPGE